MSTNTIKQYEQKNDFSGDALVGDSRDNDYVSRTDQSHIIPVQKDQDPVEDPYDKATADSDEQLARDEKDAIDKDNIIDSRTRGASKKAGAYTEPSDEEGLPGAEDGTSAIRK